MSVNVVDRPSPNQGSRPVGTSPTLVDDVVRMGRDIARFNEKWTVGDMPAEWTASKPPYLPCWVWVAGKYSNGYGKFSLGRRHILAHRFSHGVFVALIPARLQVDHLCRNRLCVNPGHLEVVTCRENLVRGIGPRLTSERFAARSHCVNGHALTPDNTSPRTDGVRRCRACQRMHASHYRARRKRAAA